MHQHRVPFVMALLVTLSLAGCLEGDGGTPFSALLAPEWEAGFEWRYDVVQSGGATFTSQGNEYRFPLQDHSSYVKTVFNTTEPLDGADVYYVHSTSRGDFAAVEPPYQAVTKDELSVAASSNQHSGSVSIYEQSWASPEGGCINAPALDVVDEDDRLTLLRFPMTAGDTWTGRYIGPDGAGLSYRAEARALRSVDVPAGRFDAVYLRLAFQELGDVFDGEILLNDYRATLELWYAPDVRNVVKSVFAVQFDGHVPSQGGDVRVDVVTSESMTGWSLAARPELPAPRVGGRLPDPVGFGGLEVVAMGNPAPNLLDGPGLVTFGVAAADRDVRAFLREAGEVVVRPVETLPAPFWDPDRFRLSWRIAGPDHVETTSTANSVGLAMDRAARWTVEARLDPVFCGDRERFHASTQVRTHLSQEFQATAGYGPGDALLHELRLDGPARAAQFVVLRTTNPAGPGVLALDGAAGRQVLAVNGETKFDYLPAGDYRVVWEADFSRLGEVFEGGYWIEF